jgi:hypothetical protein
MAKQTPIAPVYRYFTVDLMTDRILTEIPLRNVSYACSLKAAGRFQGKIPVTAETDSMSLYDSTMPGNTALYVMRNGVCVWGGIIWSRSYSFSSRDLEISASEFTSYLYHRKIWKTWNHQYGASVSYVPESSEWQIMRTNLAINPRGTSVAGRTGTVGGGPAPTLSVTSTAGMNVGGLGIDTFVRAESTSSGTYIDLRSTYSGNEIEFSDSFSMSNWVRPSTISGASAAVYVQQYNSSDVLIGTTQSAAITLSSGWNNVVFSTSLFPSTVKVTVVTRVLGSVVTGSRLDLTGELWEASDSVGTYFDGSTANTSTKQYLWTNAADSSTTIYQEKKTIPANWSVLLDNGSYTTPKPGSTVKLEFNEPSNFQYNGSYRVADTPQPTTDGFSIIGGSAVADLKSVEMRGGWSYWYTKENHGYKTGDRINVKLQTFNGSPSTIDGVFTVDVPDGPESNMFRSVNTLTYPLVIVEGTASRPLPRGDYTDVTVTVRLDAFDYIRSLIDSTFNDFVGTDFPNVYIEPGISYDFDIIKKESLDGYSILQTSKPHNIAPGQAIQVRDVGPQFDGEFEITDTPSPTHLVYRNGGRFALSDVSITEATITAVQMSSGLATVTSTSAHGLSKGQHVTMVLGDAYEAFSGTWVILDVPTPTTFRYQTYSTLSVPQTTLPNARATVGSTSVSVVRVDPTTPGYLTFELGSPIPFTVGNSVTVAEVNRTLSISEKALDAPNNRATIRTEKAHGLAVGDTVSITGLSDTTNITSKTSTTTTTRFTTARPHNLRVGNVVDIQGLDSHKIVKKQLTSSVATITTQYPHNLTAGMTFSVNDLYDSYPVASRRIVNGTARISTPGAHNLKLNDQVTIAGLDDRYTVVSKEAVNGLVTLTTSAPHNILIGQKIKIAGIGTPFNSSEAAVTDVTATRVMYRVDERHVTANKQAAAKGKKPPVPMTVPLSKASGTITVPESFYNGSYTVTGVGTKYVEFFRGGNDQPSLSGSGTNFKIMGPSVFNGTYTVSSVGQNTISYARSGANIASTDVPLAKAEGDVQATVTNTSLHSGSRAITAVTSNSFTIAQSLPYAVTEPTSLTAQRASIFNGTRTVTGVPTSTHFTFSLTGYSASVLEQTGDKLSLASVTNTYNGTYNIWSVDTNSNTFTVSKTIPAYSSENVLHRGTATVRPVVIISSFGPYPGNANLSVQFESRDYTGINIEPIAYRGFELKTVGEALDEYSDNINGFEYRIDCSYDREQNKFVKTFVLLPINFPNPPAPGEVAPISRYGADKLIFEYPGGNITEVSIDESAEEAATRFFAAGETDLGPEAGPNIGVASAEDLLKGRNGRKWPLLDATENVSGVDDKNELYAFAKRYLSEAAPPYTTLNVSLNGSIAPLVGSYRPGDWCALILDDPFMKMRLGTALEPRADVIVRKIDSFKVNVPDAVTFPETVNLDLVAEWEVDKRGK